MQARKRKTKLGVVRHKTLASLKQFSQLAAVVLLALSATLLLRHFFPQHRPAPVSPAQGNTALASGGSSLEVELPTQSQKKHPSYHVGIVAGHSGNDPGAVCPDGLAEVDINLSVAREVVSLLKRRNYTVDLLQEFDEGLTGYKADALVSIHSDSCEVPGASGFKVARVTDSALPKAEDRLVNCLYQEYQSYTGLPRHPNSITDNMTNYHAFWEIDKGTPGAIIEIGFMLEDRQILVSRPKVVARGIAAGIICFLEDGH